MNNINKSKSDKPDYHKSSLKSLLTKMVVGTAIITGTFIGNNESLTPFYNNKTGATAGINIGLDNHYSPSSKFYGVNISLYSEHKPGSEFSGLDLAIVSENNGTVSGASLAIANIIGCGTINGASLGIANISKDTIKNEINGLEAGLLNVSRKNAEYSTINGVQLGVVNGSRYGHALQLGLVNLSEKGNTLQLGLVNTLERKDSTTNGAVGLNYNFEKVKQ